MLVGLNNLSTLGIPPRLVERVGHMANVGCFSQPVHLDDAAEVGWTQRMLGPVKFGDSTDFV